MKIVNGQVTGMAIRPKAKKAKPPKRDVYILDLSDSDGCKDVRVVDAETYKWITGPVNPPSKGATSWIDPTCPEAMRKRIEWIKGEVTVTIGSCENDRALLALSIEGYDEYGSVTGAVRAIKRKGDRLKGDYSGYVY